ncbi:BlaR1 peptidase M56 [Posidoniimonas corsicana]|uniref:BlaR1 peptidase M56 n=1 Tax=Posidoniimonas corsicana TaxID=1938618 RepID=A0A5C5V7T4_9BACT|nr:M56 family metallopeptidase [Posidoniimonas corsicana]TWT33822.1 BlaR1 peptidase M56 [Posidoniimonas corsicana]
MNTLLETLASGILRATLVTSVSAVLAIMLLAVLRVRSPKLHRLAWALVVAQGCLLAPFTWRVEVDKPQVAPPPLAPVEAVASDLSIPDFPTRPTTPSPRPFDLFGAAMKAALAAWALGVAALATIGLARYVGLFVHGKPGGSPDNQQWLAEWREVRAASPLAASAEFRTTDDLGPLVCWAPWEYLVLAPTELWSRLTSADRVSILRHELAHCERGDLWKNLAVRVLALPQWFNPLVWLAVRRFDEAGEWACDDRVAGAQAEPSTDYAGTLLRVADFATRVPGGAVGAAGGELSRRVTRLLQSPKKETSEMKAIMLPLLLTIVGLMQIVRIERVAAVEQPPQIAPTAAAPPAADPPEPQWSFDEPYVIEPPDVLLVNLLKIVPKPPHKIEPFDGLLIRVTNANEPIGDAFAVSPEGTVDLGPTYGKVKVIGLRIEEAQEAVHDHLSEMFEDPRVSVSLGFSSGAQQIVGEHLVAPDGRVNLGAYGSVYVTGLTIEQAKKAIEEKLSELLVTPEVAVDVFAYNSKKYFIINESPSGDTVTAMPVTGNETVLDALASIGGLRRDAKIWVDRATDNQGKRRLVKPVDYQAIKQGDSSTNYRLWPGDRLFIDYPSPPAAKPQAAPPARAPEAYGARLPRMLPPSTHDTAPPTTEGDNRVINAKLRVVTDPHKNLRGVGGLAADDLVVSDSTLVEGLVDVLTKNGLVKVLARPRIMALNGQTGQFAIQTDEAPIKQISVELQNRHSGAQVIFRAHATVEIDERKQQLDTAFALAEGQSCLMRLRQEEPESDADDLYLLVTRE